MNMICRKKCCALEWWYCSCRLVLIRGKEVAQLNKLIATKDLRPLTILYPYLVSMFFLACAAISQYINSSILCQWVHNYWAMQTCPIVSFQEHYFTTITVIYTLLFSSSSYQPALSVKLTGPEPPCQVSIQIALRFWLCVGDWELNMVIYTRGQHANGYSHMAPFISSSSDIMSINESKGHNYRIVPKHLLWYMIQMSCTSET